MIEVINNLEEFGTITIQNEYHEQAAVNKRDILRLIKKLQRLLPSPWNTPPLPPPDDGGILRKGL